MADAPIENLSELLGALAKERSLTGRVRVIGRAWKLLRKLSPAERDKVALRMGSRFVWRRLERTFMNDGQLSEDEAAVGRMLERMGDSDPKQLREMARSLRRGDHGAAKDMLTRTVLDALEQEAEDAEISAEHYERFAGLEREDVEELAELAGDVADGEASVAEVVKTAAGVLASSLAEPVAERDEDEREEEPAEAAAPKPSPPRPPAAKPITRPAPKPKPAAAPSAPPPLDWTMPSWDPPPPPEPPAPLAAPDPVAAEGAIDGVGRLRRLRQLSAEDRPGASLGRAGRGRLIASLGGGWASRRALTRMILGRSLDDLDEALGLITGLARPMQQTWCLVDLLEGWDLDADQVARVLAAAPTDAARRRLARRAPAA